MQLPDKTLCSSWGTECQNALTTLKSHLLLGSPLVSQFAPDSQSRGLWRQAEMEERREKGASLEMAPPEKDSKNSVAGAEA